MSMMQRESILLLSVTSRKSSCVAALLMPLLLFTRGADAEDLRVMKAGLGSGTITSTLPGIDCGGDCDESYGSDVPVTLTATADAGSTFQGWELEGEGAITRQVKMSADRSVRAVFDLDLVSLGYPPEVVAIPQLSVFTPEGIQDYLDDNPEVNTAARFISALPLEYKTNWILMSRSESLQTGTAQFPRLLLPSEDVRFVFSVGLALHDSFPGSHPDAVEYMQWDAGEKNFRFHEIVLDDIPPMGRFDTREKGVSIDDSKCTKCHSTRNIPNRSASPGFPEGFYGTTGDPIGLVQAKNKPNWDAYDSWAGMLPFNRDRIYKGSVEAAAFRKILNLWTWRTNDAVRSIFEQLELQPPGVPVEHVITRTIGGPNDGHINFAFDDATPVLTEPAPVGTAGPIMTSYSFDRVAGAGPATPVVRGGDYVTLHHSSAVSSNQGRGVFFFDFLGGLEGDLNQQRVADELINHRFATGSVSIDVRPLVLAIVRGSLSVDEIANTVTSTLAHTIDLGFFEARHGGMTINELVDDTETRAFSLPRRKADIQRTNLDRSIPDGLDIDSDPDSDPYINVPTNGLIQEYGAATSAGMDTSFARLRQEVFRRPIDEGFADRTPEMGGILVDRERPENIERVALFRYFLEPLGVSVDHWSMGVRGRSLTYTFADVLGSYIGVFDGELTASLGDPMDPDYRSVPGLTDPNNVAQLIAAVNSTLSSLPPSDDPPTYTDVQRIFNKGCIACHGGLGYPPYSESGTADTIVEVDFSEDEDPIVLPPPAERDSRLKPAYDTTIVYTTDDPMTSYLYQLITRTDEYCSIPIGPGGVMPCGGAALSKADTETIRRWIEGPPVRAFTHGDPHIRTINGDRYDFQASGEFVLLRGINLEIQARQTAVETDSPMGPNAHTGLTSCVSVNGAVAVRVGRHRITYQPNLSGVPDPDGLQLRVDGELVQMSAQGVPLASGARIIQTIAPGGIQIEAPGGTVIVITPGWWNRYQLWYLNIDARHVRAKQGLMGSIAPGNWLPALPDGTFMGPRPADLQLRYKHLYDVFGNAWRVTKESSLFDYAAGTSTETFTLESWPRGESSNSCDLPEESQDPLKRLDLEVAKEHCAGIVDPDRREDCIQDVMVTGDPVFAQTYLLSDKIDRNVFPTAPVLAFPEKGEIVVASPVTFAWNPATDLDGDPITYRHYVWSVGKIPNYNDAEPVSIIQSPGFIRSDSNSDGTVDISDAIFTLGCQFGGTACPECLDAADSNDDGEVDVSDAIYTLSYQFQGGPAPPSPFPECGPDGTADDLACTSASNCPEAVTTIVTQLEPGAYYWKVFAEDGKGGTVESEIRRFQVE